MEWEFALVDAHTRDLSNEATAVIAEIGENPRVHKELLRNTVEVVSGICDCTGQAIEDLRETLGPARRIVRLVHITTPAPGPGSAGAGGGTASGRLSRRSRTAP